VPSKSRAQQRLMQAAEHGATFSLAEQVRRSMTHQQLHDFASGPEKGKPEHVKRELHPALKQHAQHVKEAHAHLSTAIPGFQKLPLRQQGVAVQEHVRQRRKNGYC